MKRLLLSLLICLFAVVVKAQTGGVVNMTVAECLQYQRMKRTRGDAIAPFRKYGFVRIRATNYLAENDTRRLWGYHVHANTEYNADSQPLYRIYKPAGLSSFAVIDHTEGRGTCQYVFWAKRYYRRFAADLRRMGFVMRNSSRQTNVLEFRKEGVDVGVDFIIWEDIYVMEVINL